MTVGEPIVNALCVDLDDLGEAFHEAGLGRGRTSYQVDGECLALLDELDELGTRATFFVPGTVLSRSPQLIREIANRGHEVASHGFRHILVGQFSRAEFRADLDRSKQELEVLIGREVDTYKAPMWGIDPACSWAYDVLLQAGFRIDHSAMPALKRHLGQAGGSHQPFLYDDGLWVIPPTTFQFGSRLALPFSGGFYCAYLPPAIQGRVFAAINRAGLPFNYYFHPFEHSPAVETLQLIRSNGLRMRIYARHSGVYRSHLRALAGRFAFGSLRDAYSRLLTV